MIGMINKYTQKAFIKMMNDAKRRGESSPQKKTPRKKKPKTYTSRDYRGVDGVLEDAQKKGRK